MSLTNRLTAYIGQAPVNAATNLTASAVLHFRLIAAEDVTKLAAELPVAEAGMAVKANDIILSVHSGYRKALLADPADVPELSSADSFNRATTLSPRYYYKDRKLYVLPASVGARAYVLSVGVVDPAGVAIDWLPQELEEASVIRAAIIELQSLIDSGIAVNFSMDDFIVAYKPATPTIADVAASSITGANIGAVIDATPSSVSASAVVADTVTKPVDLDVAPATGSSTNASASPIDDAALAGITPGSAITSSVSATTAPAAGSVGSFPSVAKPAEIAATITAIINGSADLDALAARIERATGDTALISGNEAGAAVSTTIGSFSPTTYTYSADLATLEAATDGTLESLQDGVSAAAVSETLLTGFDEIITSITTRLSSEDDVEVASALVAQANQVLAKFQGQLQFNIETHRQKLETFKTELERQVRQIEIKFKDRELDIADKQARASAAQVDLGRAQQASGVDQIKLRAEELKSSLEQFNEQAKIQRNQLRNQDRQSEIGAYSRAMEARTQALTAALGDYRANVEKANAEFQGTLSTYNGALQATLAKFQADVQGKIQDAQLSVNVSIANASNATQAAVQVAANKLQQLLTNASLANQVALANATNALQASLANASQANQVELTNAANTLQILLRNADFGNQVKLSNAANALQAAITQAQVEASVEQANLQKDLELSRLAKVQADQLATVNAANDLQAKVQNLQKGLTLFNADVQMYSNAVGLYTQEKSAQVQMASLKAQTYLGRIELLRGLYAETLSIYINKGAQYAQAPATNN